MAAGGLEVTLVNSQETDLLSLVTYPLLCTELLFKLFTGKAHSMMKQNQELAARSRPPRRDLCLGLNRSASCFPRMYF